MLRSRLKDKSEPEVIRQYKITVFNIKTQLTATRRELKHLVKAYEQDYYVKHSSLPPQTDQQYTDMTKKIHFIQKLLLSSDFV